MGRTASLAVTVLLTTAACGSSALAGSEPTLPPVDLGDTNIVDGEGGPGWMLENIANGYGAGRLSDSDGGDAAGSNEQRIVTAIIHPVYTWNTSWVGTHPGVEVLVPITSVRNAFAGGGSGRDSGLGDVTIAPFLQWWTLHPGAGSVSARLGFQFVVPTGGYSPAAAVNTGQGGWQFSPYLAMTWRVTSRWEVSARAIYDWSSPVNGVSTAGAPIRQQPGDLFALNASTSYAVTPALRLGVGSYLLHQLGPSTAGGAPAPDSSLQRVYGIGPVSRWQIGKTALLGALYQEVGARNRPEGISVNVRVQHVF